MQGRSKLAVGTIEEPPAMAISASHAPNVPKT
jgi:hypothetical protein